MRACISAVLMGWPVFSAAETLTTTAEVRALPPEQAGPETRVALEGVATFYHPDWGVLFIHDGMDGVCVGVPVEVRPETPFKKGDPLRIEGWVSPGEFLPVVLPEKIERNGDTRLPPYREVTADELFEPALDSGTVEVEAVVKGTSFSDQCLVVDLLAGGRAVRALVPESEARGELPWELLERRVRVRGVAGTHFNDQRQMSGRLLFVSDLASFTLADEPGDDAGEAPLVAVDHLLRVDTALRQRVRVRGSTTHVVAGQGLYLRGEGGSLFAQTAEPLDVAVGDSVEVEGYPLATPFRPSLSARRVTHTKKGELPVPRAFEPSRTRNSDEHGELVTLEADFIETLRTREGPQLLCRAREIVFEVIPPKDAVLPALEPGMRLRVTGICQLVSTRPLVIPRNATGFRILLRGPEDLHILASPPWWNAERALWVVGAVLLLAAIAGIWAVALQVVVQSQSAVIRRQAEQHASLEERQRIARDLHDTLEQELVGVNMLLDTASGKLSGQGAPNDVSQPLELARGLLRRARAESRATILELRSTTLQRRGLPAAITDLLKPLATAGGAKFTVEVEGKTQRLAGTVETHLLRIAQEAVANAAHHGQAKSIRITVAYDAEAIRIRIEDDGRGFDPSTAPAGPGSHMGLTGMRERAAKISGRLEVRSQSGAGTTVEVTAPLRPTRRSPILS